MRSVRGWLLSGLVSVLAACGAEEVTPASPPSIIAQPGGLFAESCQSAAFAVLASGTPPLSYQWFENGTPVVGASSASLVLERVGPADGGRAFTVEVSNAAGTARSDEATLTVSDPGGEVVLATGLVGGLASDGSTIYWADGLGVRAASVDCSGPIRTLYERGQVFENAIGLAFAAGRVVWADTVTGTVRSVPVEGGSATTLASGVGDLYELAVGGGQVYWPYTWGVQTVSLEGGAVVTLASGATNAGGIAVDDQYVYWTDLTARTVNRVPIGGGQVAVLASGQEYPNAIASDGQSVYWAIATDLDTDRPAGHVMKVSRDGGLPVVRASPGHVIGPITLDESSLYWTGTVRVADTTPTGSISRLPMDGSQPASMLADALELPRRIAVDSRYVYWSDARGIVRLEK